jgi:hypothetical protein
MFSSNSIDRWLDSLLSGCLCHQKGHLEWTHLHCWDVQKESLTLGHVTSSFVLISSPHNSLHNFQCTFEFQEMECEIERHLPNRFYP